MSELDGFYVRGTEQDVPKVEAALESIPYDRGAIQVTVEFDPRGGWDIAVDIETFRGVSAVAATATLRSSVDDLGFETTDSDTAYAAWTATWPAATPPADRLVDGVVYYREADLPAPQSLGALLADLNLRQASPEVRRAGLAEWLSTHEPSKQLARSFERRGYGDLLRGR